jgi:hypothetical protein
VLTCTCSPSLKTRAMALEVDALVRSIEDEKIEEEEREKVRRHSARRHSGTRR